ncbi:MAG: hypothetical protein U1E36_02855 [Rickettsiales bacterium]
MITLLGSLFGFIGSMLPEALHFFKDRQDKMHELKILELQLSQQRQGHIERLEEIQTQADIAESSAIYKTYITGIHWVDALNGTVRPVLAYAFFLLYALTKFLQILLVNEVTPQLLPVLWGEEDQAIFAGIISFYFGQRAFAKFRK